MFIYDAVVFLKHAGKTLLSARGKKLKFVKHEFLTSKDACSNRVRNAIFLLFFLFIFHFCFSIMVARRVFVIFYGLHSCRGMRAKFWKYRVRLKLRKP